MNCPNCGTEYEGGCCPLCGGLDEDNAVRPAFLMSFSDQLELEMACEILERAGIPYFCREPGSGEYLRLVTGENMFGTDLYVDMRCTHRAMRLLRRFDRAADLPFDEADLDAAIEHYAETYGAEPETGEPASPEGYRMVWVFLAIFGVLAVLSLIAVLLRQ